MEQQSSTSTPLSEWSPAELVKFIREQHAEITRQDLLLVVKDQENAHLKAELLSTRNRMDPYEVACEIASKESPSPDDMRRLRAAEVAIAYCGRPRVSESRSVSVVGYGDMNGIAARLERARLKVINGGNGERPSPDESTEPPPSAV